MVFIFFIILGTLLSSIKVNYIYSYNQSSIIIKVIFSEKLKTKKPSSITGQRWDHVMSPSCFCIILASPQDPAWTGCGHTAGCRTSSCWPWKPATYYGDPCSSNTSQEDKESKSLLIHPENFPSFPLVLSHRPVIPPVSMIHTHMFSLSQTTQAILRANSGHLPTPSSLQCQPHSLRLSGFLPKSVPFASYLKHQCLKNTVLP